MNLFMRTFIGLPILFLFASLEVQGNQDSERAKLFTAAATSVSATREALRVPGVSLAVGMDRQVAWRFTSGLADLEHYVGVRPETRFRIGSISKPVTATVLDALVRNGSLDLDDPISKHLDDLPEHLDGIRIRHLAANQSGVRHYLPDDFRDGDAVWWQHYQHVSESLEVFIDSPLDFPAGANYGYSTFGWTLLAAVLEQASGKDFEELIDEHVFQPAGMRYATLDHAFRIIPDRTRFYAYNPFGDGIMNAPFTENSYKWAGGGMLANPEDLVNFASFWMHDLPPSSRERMWTRQLTSQGEKTPYGLGWFVDLESIADSFRSAEEDVPAALEALQRNGVNIVHHPGGQIGGSSLLLIAPEFGLSVATMWNIHGVGRHLYSESLALMCGLVALESGFPIKDCAAATKDPANGRDAQQ